MRIALLTAALAATLATTAAAEAPVQVERTSAERTELIRSRSWWANVEAEVPAMKHDLGDRWPMIVWHAPGAADLTPDRVRFLLDRGLTQHLSLDTSLVETARMLHDAGSKVIMMQGRAGNFPYSLAPDSSDWAHQFDEGYHYEDAGPGPLGQWHGACPLMIGGWAHLGDFMRETLGAYRDAGVPVDGVWLDWEGDPYPFNNLFGQLAHCHRCRAQLPPEVLTDRQAWFQFSWRLFSQLHGAYVAGPAREVFPRIAITNWHIVFSSQTRPIQYFVDDKRPLPPLAPPLFTASNPVAYGNDKFFDEEWRDDYVLDRRHVDQFNMHNLLRQVTDDAANRAAYAPESMSFPWVSRWCPLGVADADSIPDMSRPAYREALRHMWLRGADGLQLFNAHRAEYESIWLEEIADAVTVYDEVLAHAEFLDGQVANFETPGPQHDDAFWSGRRLDDRAFVRIVSQADGPRPVRVEAWPGAVVELQAPVAGRYVLLQRDGDEVRVID